MGSSWVERLCMRSLRLRLRLLDGTVWRRVSGVTLAAAALTAAALTSASFSSAAAFSF